MAGSQVKKESENHLNEKIVDVCFAVGKMITKTLVEREHQIR